MVTADDEYVAIIGAQDVKGLNLYLEGIAPIGVSQDVSYRIDVDLNPAALWPLGVATQTLGATRQAGRQDEEPAGAGAFSRPHRSSLRG